MIQLTHETHILLGVAPADFRRGIDGFTALCRLQLAQDPRDGTVFVFINRARTMIRALSYDGSGFWLMTKRISKGRFTGWPQGNELLSSASAQQLRGLLQGSHWQPTASPAAQGQPNMTALSPTTPAAQDPSTTLFSSPRR